eukprot:351612-Chlamydomonas_euryale.AAC.23
MTAAAAVPAYLIKFWLQPAAPLNLPFHSRMLLRHKVQHVAVRGRAAQLVRPHGALGIVRVNVA